MCARPMPRKPADEAAVSQAIQEFMGHATIGDPGRMTIT